MPPALARVSRLFSPAAWVGPIFEKELRVAGRRRRNYFLRAAYLLLLTGFVTLVYLIVLEETDRSNARGYQTARMAEIGKAVVATVAWFQFAALQLLAVILCSTSISDEVYHRTLGVLMTTPINSFQIVVGKMLSRMWQLFILLAVSLPLLAVARVFGGVPWDYVVSTTCITLTATLFAGAVSMFFSIGSRHAWAVILKTLAAGAVLYLLLPWIAVVTLDEVFSIHDDDFYVAVFSCVHPVGAMVLEMMDLMSPGLVGGTTVTPWPIHCGSMLAASAAILAICVIRVRRAALRQIGGGAGTAETARPGPTGVVLPVPLAPVPAGPESPLPVQPILPVAPAPAGRVRPVGNWPILWKELRTPMFRRLRSKLLVFIGVPALLLITYALCGSDIDDGETQIAYALVFVVAGLLTTAVVSATTITSEKEANSWPILLATPLSGWQIVLGKFLGVARRTAGPWVLLVAHLAFFTVVGLIHPFALFTVPLAVGACAVFVVAAGIYLSVKLKRTTAAVIASLGLVLAIWLVLPLLGALIIEAGDLHESENPAGLVVSANPVMQTGVILDSTAGRDWSDSGPRENAAKSLEDLRFDWPDENEKFQGDPWYGRWDASATLGRIGLFAALHVMLAGLLMLAAARAIRRRSF